MVSTTENGVHVLRVPHFIPARPSGTLRLLHYTDFALSCFLPTLWAGLTWRPDVVFTIVPSLIAAPVARLVAFFGGAKSWLRIQDLEVEAAFATGLVRDKNVVARLARAFENSVLKMLGTVSTISPQMCSANSMGTMCQATARRIQIVAPTHARGQ